MTGQPATREEEPAQDLPKPREAELSDTEQQTPRTPSTWMQMYLKSLGFSPLEKIGQHNLFFGLRQSELDFSFLQPHVS